MAKVTKLITNPPKEESAPVVESIPPGVILQYSSLTPPSGWLICDGSAVSRTTYSALFAIIGVSFGSGNGSTTFNLPNFKGRVPVGYDNAQTEFDALGEAGGAKTHTLTEAQMPSHTHNAAHENDTIQGWWGGGALRNSFSGTWHGKNAVTTATGGGQAHNNLQPYLTVPFIIKT